MLRPRATRTPGIIRALSRAKAATIRAAIRTAPISVISRVYQMSWTRRAYLAHHRRDQAGRCGYRGCRQLGDRPPQGGELAERGLAVHAVLLVRVPVGAPALGGLLQQEIDVGAARQGGGVAARRGASAAMQGRSLPFLQRLRQRAARTEQVAADGRLGAAGHGCYLSV